MSYPIEFNIDNNGAPITNNLKAEARDPMTLTLVTSQTFVAPHTFPLSVALFVDDPKAYLMRVVEVTGGGDVVRNEFVQDVSKEIFNTLDDLTWVVNRSEDDPVAGETTFYDPRLNDTNWRLIQRGVGPLEPGVEFNYKEDPDNEGVFGVELLDGREFNYEDGEGDTYFIQFYPPDSTASRDIFIRVGRGLPQDPIAGSAGYRWSPLAGKRYRVVQRGFGELRSDEITIVAEGGWDLEDDALFNYDDTYVIQFYPTVVIQNNVNSSVGKMFDGLVYITAGSNSYDAEHIGKLIRFAGAGSTCKYVLPLGGALPVNRMLCFEHAGGTSKFGTIETSGGEDIEFFYNGAVVLNDQVWIGKNEYMYLQWDGTNSKWVIVQSNWAINEVGSFVDCYIELPNALPCNGALKIRAEYPRCWFIVEQFYSSHLVPEGSYNPDTHRGKFTNGDGSTTMRVPDWDDMSPVSAGSEINASQYQADQVGQFTGNPINAKAGSHGGASDAEAGTIALLNNSGTSEVDFVIKGSATVHNVGKVNRVKRIGVMRQIRT